jgi:hypothetical protein
LNIAAEIVRVENDLDIPQAVAGERRDLRHRVAPAMANRTTAVPQVMERQVPNASAVR